MKQIILILIASFVLTNSYAQDTTSIKKVIQNMFIAMKNSDTVLLRSCFATNAVIQTIQSTATGADVKEAPLQSFLNSIGKSAAGTIDERIVFDKILINKELASVWTPYQLYIKDKYMHQGVDSFQVVFTKEGWKIQYLIDTRYP
ncbi:MAG: hypothetical protein NTY43_05170 [Bacteroidetes bacterium]|jgi:DNA-directed RNA polymerase|nr:hypothetical protein [Bacteroidota bacterium]